MPDYSPDLLEKEERSKYDLMSPEERALFDADNRRMVADFNDPAKRAAILADIDKKVADIDRQYPMPFNDVREKRLDPPEDEDELADIGNEDEKFKDDDITSMAHAELELHREVREYARITAWDMPLLSSKH